MIVTRKIGSLIRGKTTPFQIFAASILGALLGMLPGFSHAPALMAFWLLLLLVLNANLFLAGIVLLLSKLVLLVAMPVVFAVGRFLLEGPTEGLFRGLVNAPVTAYSGLDYYVVTGGQFLGLVFGIGLGVALTRTLRNYRLKMIKVEEGSEKMRAYSTKPWVKALKFLFLGKGRGKKSYEELLSVKVGNPFRIWGVVLVVILVAVVAIGFSKFSTPLITSIAKSNLEAANGATVDLEEVDLNLGESKLQVLGLAMADPQKLDTNIFAAQRIVADVNSRDLLRKRFSIDSLILEDAASGNSRETPGVIVGPKPKPEKKETELPDYDDLDDVLQNSGEWKERLAQAKRWLEQVSGGDEEGEDSPTWEEELNSRIRSMGYVNVKADFLTEGSPTFWIRNLESLGIRTPYFDGATLDLVGNDLSTHPKLAGAPPRLSLVSSDQKFDAQLNLAGASGTGTNDVQVKLNELAVDPIGSQIKSSGEPPLYGGTMNVDLGGEISTIENNLVLRVSFDDSNARIAGKVVSLDGVTLPLAIRGPLDSPAVKLEGDALKKVLGSAAKEKLLDEAGKKLGLEGEDADKASQLLDGLFKKKKEPSE